MKYFRLPGLAGILVMLCCAAPAVRAADPSPAGAAPVSAAAGMSDDKRQALMNIARQFVDKMNDDMDKADTFLDRIQPEDLRVQKYFDAIPDGENLLLLLNLGKVSLENPVNAIKQGHDVMISLQDFVTTASLPIRVDSEAGTANGWFIRQENHFQLDLKAKKVVSKGKTFDIQPGDVQVQDGDLLVKGQTLAKWFDFDLIVDVASQAMLIDSPQKFPAEEKADRDALAARGDYQEPPPHLPRADTPQAMFSIPNIDVNLDQSYNRVLGTPTPAVKATGYSIETDGDSFGYTNKTVITGDDQDRLQSIRSTYSRQSDNADLLGPLKARYYEFGDITTPQVPFAAQPAPGLGIHATNKDPFTTSDTVTQITGNATPGWDVELYRDDQYLALATAGADGRYTFKDVTLFAGDNHFRIEQYGPQGELKEEKQVITVTPNIYNASGGAYELSASLQDTQTYVKVPNTATDVNTPALVATYAHQLTHDMSGQVGLVALYQNKKQVEYAHAGIADTIDQAIINLDTVAESNSSYTAAAAIRRQFGGYGLSATAQYSTPNYDSQFGTPLPSVLDLKAAVSGPIPVLQSLIHPAFQLSTDNAHLGDNSARTQNSLSVNARYKNLSFDNALNEISSTPPGGGTPSVSESGTANIRGNALGFRWRASEDYNVKPTPQTTQYALELDRTLNPKLSSDFQVAYDPIGKIRSEQLSLSWNGDHAIVTPSLGYDTNKNLDAKVNVRFGLSHDPKDDGIYMTGQTATDKGGLSAMVFLDRDGDNKFGPGDELLEGVTIEAVHDDLEADTDEKGEAYIPNLPAGKLTDVIVQSGSNFDPTWVSGIEGVSVRPRPGHVDRVEFPIHIGGTMDGTIYANMPVGKPHVIKDLHLSLYDGDGKIVMNAVTGYDGYYTFDAIPPGSYLLILSGDDARDQHIIRPPPEPIEIGFKGTILTGHNIYATYGRSGDVPVSMQADLNDYASANPALDKAALKDKVIVLNLGAYNSRELMAVVWYKLKTRYAAIVGDTHLLVQPADSYALPKTGKNVLRTALPGYDLQGAWKRCSVLTAAGEYCAVEIVPKGLQELSAAGDGPPKS